MPHIPWRMRLDHTMIGIVIVTTVIPYWGGFFPYETPFGWSLIIFMIIFSIMIRLVLNPSSILSGGIYLLIGTPVLFDLTRFWELLPSPSDVFFMVGMTVYVLSLIIYTYHWFDFYPNVFGYRGVQHILLISATTLHGLASLGI